MRGFESYSAFQMKLQREIIFKKKEEKESRVDCVSCETARSFHPYGKITSIIGQETISRQRISIMLRCFVLNRGMLYSIYIQDTWEIGKKGADPFDPATESSAASNVFLLCICKRKKKIYRLEMNYFLFFSFMCTK